MRLFGWLILFLSVGVGAVLWRLSGWVTASPQPASQAHVAFDVSPDGHKVVFTDVNSDLYLLDLQTRKVARLTTTEAWETAPAFSPDGKSIAYSVTDPGSELTALWIRTLDGKEVRQLTRGTDGMDYAPSFYAGGKWIVFGRSVRIPLDTGGSTRAADIYVIGRDGQGLRRVTHERYYSVVSPRVGPGEKAVIYAADKLDLHRLTAKMEGALLLKADLIGAKLPQVVGPVRPPGFRGAWVSTPHLARDGKTIVFISDRNHAYRYDLFLMNSDGTGVRPLGVTRLSSYNTLPVLLPRGKGVLFLGDETHNNQPVFGLYQVDLDGTNLRLLADGALFTQPLQWQDRSPIVN